MVTPYTDLTQDLGDRLTEYELVEDLIERGTLEENADGTLPVYPAEELLRCREKFKSGTFSNNINSARLQMFENL